VIERDKRCIFRFAALQSPVGTAVLRRAGFSGDLPDSVVLLEGDGMYFRSDAAIRTCVLLGGWWRVAGIFRIVPRRLRDKVYDRVAANRYAWFGRKEGCWVPTPALRERFLE
jgi:predicted DCC family thiol-disulfide oxidoreductase YuxK